MTETFSVLPLSPARECARSRSFTSGFLDGDPARHAFARQVGGHHGEHFARRFHRPATAGGSIRVERFHFVSNRTRLSQCARAPGDTQANFVRMLMTAVCVAMKCIETDEIHA